MKIDKELNRFADPDEAYRLLIEAHRDLTDGDSEALNARLILVLANQLGDLEALKQAIEVARRPMRGAD